MTLKLKNGVYPLTNGMPQQIDGHDEILQNVKMCFNLQKGVFPYGRELGSRLSEVDKNTDHASDIAVAIANEALSHMAGVEAETATFLSNGRIRIYVTTPTGGGNVVYGSL